MKQELIDKLDLQPLEAEGGYYKRMYTSSETDANNRGLGSHIYYFLDSDDFSAWHRLDCDEIWHFYRGSDVILHRIDEQGELSCTRLGNYENGCQSFCIVPAGTWIAAEVGSENAQALMGCTCFPAFTADGFEVASSAKLGELFPQHVDVISRLTRT